MQPHTPARGFTLVECLTACALAALLVTLALPSFSGHDVRAGRLDAVAALTKLQAAQEQHRSHHGLYAGELGALLGVADRSAQGRYRIGVAITGPQSYEATATALGKQAQDSTCSRLTVSVKEGFAQLGPNAGCWLR